ncbi:glycine cleavage system aminomethyltransferase GcvT [Pararhodobacter oceanensis]|uniref:aminomethyltransferase n=1 Tax=Pararhodobacter oceanensis TaxID=2172121 RepID=A0A2T8HU86_9RHOB|nr:glycine cleavage system aminomethyltransferase GcvT [Pararhodobacter oceanensis]PVH28946.1 glycine cleavage system aminomethyltransferase GcvT [Pararhodobacter oceanensis]
MTDLKRTPLYDLHREMGAKLVPFAGYEMPVQYPMGVMGEHQHTRSKAGLFDVSHMGQVILRGEGAAEALETLVPVDVVGLKPGRQRYAMFTNEGGGILDDFMVANRGDHLLLVVNAACKDADIAHLQKHLSGVEPVTDRALIALQGPQAEEALARLVSSVTDLKFMDFVSAEWNGAELWISRSGYTGEDGFEVSIPELRAEEFTRLLLEMDEVMPIGLGARDSLRLEAGLCLYGNDIGPEITPIEAGLNWAIPKVRRTGGDREGGFPGAARILDELANGASRKRVGLRPESRAPMRDGTPLFAHEADADPIGAVTSGGFGPSVGMPISMGYVPPQLATAGTQIWGEVRGKRLPVQITPMPFRPSTYRK